MFSQHVIVVTNLQCSLNTLVCLLHWSTYWSVERAPPDVHCNKCQQLLLISYFILYVRHLQINHNCNANATHKFTNNTDNRSIQSRNKHVMSSDAQSNTYNIVLYSTQQMFT
jgi:hypothetical protein